MPTWRNPLLAVAPITLALAQTACQIDGSSQAPQWKEASSSTYEVVVVRDDQNRQFQAAVIHTGFLEQSRVSPILGRRFFARELTQGELGTAMVSYAHWEEAFNRDPAVIGKSIRLNGEPFTVVGLMPRGYDFPPGTKLWLCRRPPATEQSPN